YEKIILRCSSSPMGACRATQPVTMKDYVDDAIYDDLLAASIVFLNLSDAPANTTIVECIARCTPVLVNKVGAVAEYLGESYPFYYRDTDEAARKLSDLDLIEATALYLKGWHVRGRVTFDYFLESLQNTALYRELPVPRSQCVHFKRYDLSVMICSYKRVKNIRHILSQLVRQTYSGTFEVIVWNNNI